MRLLRAADRAALAWRNGGGVTCEIAAFPPGSAIDAFDWRISIAEIAAAGPFSRFDGIDRILTVLDGGLALREAGGPAIALEPGRPFGFAGEAAIDGAPIGGAARALNVMVRRGRWRAHVGACRSDARQDGKAADGLRIAVATAAAAGIARLDALWLDPGEPPPAGFAGLLIALDRQA